MALKKKWEGETDMEGKSPIRKETDDKDEIKWAIIRADNISWTKLLLEFMKGNIYRAN